jgi:Protein of unknown function (DUF3489)
MKLFSIDAKDRIQAEDSTNVRHKKSGLHFASERQWARIAIKVPMSRLVEIWNALPGVVPVQRFESRRIALRRIWTALQHRELKRGRTVRQPDVHFKAETRAHARSKGGGEASEGRAAQVIALLEAEGGASLDQLVEATGWQRHSVRGFLSGTIRKKMGMNVISSINAIGARIYSISR